MNDPYSEAYLRLKAINNFYQELHYGCLAGSYTANIFLFKVSKINTRKRCEICSKLTIKHQNDIHDFN